MRLTIIAFVGILLVFVSILSTAELLAQPAGFSFRFEFGSCQIETLDTFTGVFSKNLGGSPPRSVTTQLPLSDQEMRIISDRILAIQFFDYPSPFFDATADQHVVAETHPSTSYRLEVRDGGRTHTVSWKDSRDSETPAAIRLRDLFAFISEVIHDRPEFKRLPPAIGGCE